MKKKLPPNPFSWQNPTPAIPRRQRQLNFLKSAAFAEEQNAKRDYPTPFLRGLRLHCQGGYGFGRDLRELVRNGYLVMRRHQYSTSLSGNHALRVSMLELTNKGRKAIELGKVT